MSSCTLFRWHAALLFLLVFTQSSSAATKDTFCPRLKAFVASVKPNEKRELEFQTSWGTGFKVPLEAKGSTGPSLLEKRCVHNGYAPAKAVCDNLMHFGSVEFPGSNAMEAIMCLSPKTQFAGRFQIQRIDAEFDRGTANRGVSITVRLEEDKALGATVLRVTADGY
ncbi:hypothetical protein [Pinirhizobacter soli]|uniref:hypothetical protein n=1 Tax=Pinirhizobacter soli TaxID=2786953 RepID=UPI002029E109|nr:hypothetical protein [Pinirhizobacter soli]